MTDHTLTHDEAEQMKDALAVQIEALRTEVVHLIAAVKDNRRLLEEQDTKISMLMMVRK